MAGVVLDKVSKIYDGNVTAVKNANLVIEDKEFVVLVGPSGCGKSTLLRMIAGLEEITAGTIDIGGIIVNNIPPKDRDIAMVFQNYALYPHMTVFENMAFGLKLRKHSKKQIKERVNEAAEILGLSDFLYRKPKALSGGQRQRVAIGRAIVRKPKVFLFDEPLSNLDAKLRVQMRIELNRLHNRLMSTMIYVTHDQVEAMTMGDRIVVLKDGLIQQVDSPVNLYKNPQSLFVAGFIGSPSMNFLAGSFSDNGKSTFKSEKFVINIPENYAQQIKILAAKNIIMGVRPENIVILKENKDLQSYLKIYDVTVDVVEPVGNETLLYLNKHGRTLCMRTNSDDIYQTGDRINIGFDINKLHLFDPSNEKRITL